MEFVNNYFDKIIFIHCIHRLDRMDNIKKLLEKTKITNYHILEATYLPKNGAKGCSHSHYRAMKMALENNWDRVLIIEDDFQFYDDINGIKTDEYFKNTVESVSNWDVIMPFWFCNSIEKRSSKINNYIRRITHKKYGAYSTLCYSVNKSIMKELQDLFHKSYKNFKDIHDRNQKQLSTDCIWRYIQKNKFWYIIIPKLGYQIETKSDIHCW